MMLSLGNLFWKKRNLLWFFCSWCYKLLVNFWRKQKIGLSFKIFLWVHQFKMIQPCFHLLWMR